ncbi:MAG TPA: hypothetical protein VM344_10585 [Vitreimonas sp.]|nr:hypothetical protein [Vitreimonas sp.]
MTDDLFTPPFGGKDPDDGPDGLPEHERDDERTVGGGVMGAGGTSVDRGTGDLDGNAQGGEPDNEEAGGVNEGMIAGTPAGGAQAYVPAFIDDDDDGGSLPDA